MKSTHILKEFKNLAKAIPFIIFIRKPGLEIKLSRYEEVVI